VSFQFGDSPVEGQSQGHEVFEAPSPPYGAVITYRLASRQSQVRVVITDAAGDTMQTLNGPGAPGINRIAWNFTGKPAPRAPLGAVQKRDSALQMQRITFVLDSLEKAGTNPMMIGMIRGLVTSGDLSPLMAMFGGGGRGGPPGFGPPPAWNPRPGEQATGGRGGGPGGAPAGLDPNAFQSQIALFAIPGKPAPTGGFAGLNFLQTLGFSQAGFGFGAGGGAGVAPGDYLVSISVGGKTLKQKLRVERAAPGAAIP
jgi:hypothetical protein